MLKFFWNGIKGADGKLQRAFYSVGQLVNAPEGTITIYAKDGRFNAEVRQHFEVLNDSDSMTDYFEDDRIRVSPDHPLYAQVGGGALLALRRSLEKMESALLTTMWDVARSNLEGDIAGKKTEIAKLTARVEA